MGSVINRGTRDSPNWYVKYKDMDDVWKRVPSHQPTKEQARKYLAAIEARVASGKVGIMETKIVPKCAELMQAWVDSLTNRNAQDDRYRLKNHLLPAFGSLRINEVSLTRVMAWIDAMRTDGRLSTASMRHNLNNLSRFFSWAIERGHASVNPVRQIPTGKRPQQAIKSDVPWLDDDAIVRKLIAALPSPLGFMFYLGNRSGLRTGELCGLRMSDLGFLDEGVIRVRFSYEGPLKEDKAGTGRVKWVPAPADARAFLGRWIAQRLAEGAGPEDLVFARDIPIRAKKARARPAGCRSEIVIARTWRATAKALGVDLTWYQATRHSFVSRNLARGASLDEVSAAVGHSSPVVTRRYYDHFVRKTFSLGLRAGLGLDAPAHDAKVIAIRVESKAR
jgi:integrase